MSFSPLPPLVRRGGWWLVGNYDGVHCGHQALIRRARQQGGPVSLLTFEPHPRTCFQPEASPFRLTPWPEREAILHRYGVTQTLVRPFDTAFAALTADAFMADVLEEQCDAAGVVVGEDFHFGANRQGTVHHLRQRWGESRVIIVPARLDTDGSPCSSSRIREALRAGDLTRATRLLGRPWSLTGIVQEGTKTGRLLGFPTANIALGSYVRPHFGAYAVTVDGFGPGVANIGRRPTFNGTEELLEVHLFDRTDDLYGQSLTVHLNAFLRPEERFPDAETLRRQIADDTRHARHIIHKLSQSLAEEFGNC